MDYTQIAATLERRFGLGTRPDLRRQLYERLQCLVEHADERDAARAYQVIASVAADAAGKADPGRYFAAVSMMRLQEKGFFQPLEL